jgi:hypothetical protein
MWTLLFVVALAAFVGFSVAALAVGAETRHGHVEARHLEMIAGIDEQRLSMAAWQIMRLPTRAPRSSRS